MPLLFPTQGTLSDAFSPRLPFGSDPSRQEPALKTEPDRYPAWSRVESPKSRAGTLGEEARTELKKASHTGQGREGDIELHSANYYATCTFGGLIACVGSVVERYLAGQLTHEAGCNSYRCDAIRPGEMPPPGGLKDVQGKF